MAKPTQAHLTRKFDRSWSQPLKDQKKIQMEYYMGAKLIEVGVDPKSAVYRWSMEIRGNSEVWTCSAYWGESKEKLSS